MRLREPVDAPRHGLFGGRTTARAPEAPSRDGKDNDTSGSPPRLVLDRPALQGVRVVEQERAFAMCRQLARTEGIFAGGSTGLNVTAAIELAIELGPGHRVVTLACDNGLKYLGGEIYR